MLSTLVTPVMDSTGPNHQLGSQFREYLAVCKIPKGVPDVKGVKGRRQRQLQPRANQPKLACNLLLVTSRDIFKWSKQTPTLKDALKYIGEW